MSKPHINETQYAALVNEKMKEHDQYTDDMGVVLTPENLDCPHGISIVGGMNAPGVVAWAEDKIHREYELVLTYKTNYD